MFKKIVIVITTLVLIILIWTYNINTPRIDIPNFSIETRVKFEKLSKKLINKNINYIEYINWKLVFNKWNDTFKLPIDLENEIKWHFINFNLYSLSSDDKYLLIYFKWSKYILTYSNTLLNYKRWEIIYDLNSIVENIINLNWVIVRYCENRSICSESKIKSN